MEYIESFAAVWIITIAILMNTENFRSAVLFKIIPGILGFLIAIDALSRLNWI